jgi:hypothetical protein
MSVYFLVLDLSRLTPRYKAMISLATNQITRPVMQLFPQANRPLFVGVVCLVPYISAHDP